MINILYFDLNTLDMEEASQIFKNVQAALPKEDTLIMLPSCCQLVRFDEEKNNYIGGFDFSL